MTKSTRKPIGATAPDIRARAETLRTRAAAASADPVFAVIEEGRQFFSAARAEYATGDGRTPQPAINALFEHFRGPLLAAKPTTPAGAIALARYAADFARLTGCSLETEAMTLLARIGDTPSA